MDTLLKAVKEKQNFFQLTEDELANKVGFTFSEHHIPSFPQLTCLLNELEISFDDITETVEETSVFDSLLNEAKTPEETAWMNRMIQMMLCIRKHHNLQKAFES